MDATNPLKMLMYKGGNLLHTIHHSSARPISCSISASTGHTNLCIKKKTRITLLNFQEFLCASPITMTRQDVQYQYPTNLLAIST